MIRFIIYELTSKQLKAMDERTSCVTEWKATKRKNESSEWTNEQDNAWTNEQTRQSNERNANQTNGKWTNSTNKRPQTQQLNKWLNTPGSQYRKVFLSGSK